MKLTQWVCLGAGCHGLAKRSLIRFLAVSYKNDIYNSTNRAFVIDKKVFLVLNKIIIHNKIYKVIKIPFVDVCSLLFMCHLVTAVNLPW